jgi:FADH2 O2-dependent halogenase
MIPAHVDVDVAIVGSGFSGSLMAMALRRRGRSVVLIERGRHPRFAIGESSTPLANLLLEELCDEYGLDAIRPLRKMGTWQQTYPWIACGLKRGFSFFHHVPGRPFADDRAHARQLLVAASPHDEVSDTHWYRPEIDAFLVRQAVNAGATYLDQTDIARLREDDHRVRLEGARLGEPVAVRARFLVDASGPRGLLHRALGMDDAALARLPETSALYAHFRDVDRWQRMGHHLSGETPPFPVDDAALHHVLPGGWIWVLRFNNGITSAGIAATAPLAAELRLEEGEAAWRRLLDLVPSVGQQFGEARAVTPFTYAPRLAFRAQRIAGRRWAMLPSAAGVIDPLLSTGFPLTLLGVQRLAAILGRELEPPRLAAALDEFAAVTARELDATESLVAALYATMGDFELFKRLALLYFAAASFTETVRRLGRPDRARGFLLSGDPGFSAALEQCVAAALRGPAGAERQALMTRIDRAVAPLDVAGLGDRTRRDWYPVTADDLLRAAPRLDASEAEIQVLLERCGFGTASRA